MDKASPNARQRLTYQRAISTKAVLKAVPKMVRIHKETPVFLDFLTLMWGFLVPLKGLEPPTPSLRMTCSTS